MYICTKKNIFFLLISDPHKGGQLPKHAHWSCQLCLFSLACLLLKFREWQGCAVVSTHGFYGESSSVLQEIVRTSRIASNFSHLSGCEYVEWPFWHGKHSRRTVPCCFCDLLQHRPPRADQTPMLVWQVSPRWWIPRFWWHGQGVRIPMFFHVFPMISRSSLLRPPQSFGESSLTNHYHDLLF